MCDPELPRSHSSVAVGIRPVGCHIEVGTSASKSSPGFDQAVDPVARAVQQRTGLAELVVHPVQQLVVVAERVPDLDRELRRAGRAAALSRWLSAARRGARGAQRASESPNAPPSARARGHSAARYYRRSPGASCPRSRRRPCPAPCRRQRACLACCCRRRPACTGTDDAALRQRSVAGDSQVQTIDAPRAVSRGRTTTAAVLRDTHR